MLSTKIPVRPDATAARDAAPLRPAAEAAGGPAPAAFGATGAVSTAPPLLVAQQLGKQFAGVHALKDVKLSVHAGEVLALIGENGAGKSTLVKILTGIYRPDAGQLRLMGKRVQFLSPQAAIRAGIVAVHQEPVMFDELTVAENIYVGRHLKNRFGLLDWVRMNIEAQALFDRLEVRLDVRTRVKDLSVAQQHFVEIARALSQDARVVILDEPTAALSQHEIRELYRLIAQLKAAGKAVIFISHKFDEIMAVADRYVVLRDGEYVGEGRLKDTTEQQLISMMVGRTITQVFPRTPTQLGPVMIQVENLCHPTLFDGIGFSVRSGEILGFYGLVGSGRSEVMQAVFGLNAVSAGTITVNGEATRVGNPRDAIAAGIAYVPEDRRQQGACMDMSILHNVTLPLLPRIGAWLLGRHGKELEVARRYTERLELKAAHYDQKVVELSGGNQQKVVLAKWLATSPRIVILDEPTKGIDIGSKSAVHHFMDELVQQGLAVILISSELPEVIGMSDRIVVMNRGRISGSFSRAEASSDKVVAAAAGVSA
ncbi:sugar ABC transporter ATP-binding protein [Solimonas sp. K1W22B-7]|uniref:sugar ABC transporter ATP-binding protein n=1 Tax=Solimonas sp. K1W22B-7 TaxID=2303331 RepID=UPI000E334D21|nr:sugar ABC transporter ATP-binding protein [Solimonas sp. K1W22B-7]AXQ30607.1 sugar ABC transporter ATP-binding protein [Solimonas sp. K1W22B-7]